MFGYGGYGGHQQGQPLKTLLGVIGIIIGLMYFLQKSGSMTLFDMSNEIYIMIFAGYALIAGIVLLFTAITSHMMHRF